MRLDCRVHVAFHALDRGGLSERFRRVVEGCLAACCGGEPVGRVYMSVWLVFYFFEGTDYGNGSEFCGTVY